MKKHIAFFCGLLIVFFHSATFAKGKSPEQLAGKVLTLLNAGQYDKCTSFFNDTLKVELNAKRLQSTWQNLVNDLGPLTKQSGPQSSKVKGFDVIIIPCKFEHLWLDVRFSFDHHNKIQGLWFSPSTVKSDYVEPSYGTSDHIVELMPTIKSGLFELPAILTLPKAGEKFPLVILVHGSGPNDKDETILNNKPFKDIALGLAEKGIATLRYDKRTKVYPQAFIQNTKFTVDEEVIQDVMSAIDLAKKFNEIDTNRIYILGHSLGGMLAPRIGKGAKSLAGIIILAGNSRPLEQLVEDQYTYLFGLDKGVNHTKELKSISSQCARISNGQFDVNTPGAELPLGIPGAYWKDLTLYNQVETAKLLTIPLLILQGESDYQVTMKDFEGWKPAMHQTKSVMISYPHLNHIFCPISRDGLSTPTDYQHPCNVESKVIEDITHWINTK